MADRKIRNAIEEYVKARKKIIKLGEKYPERIGGNDNIIGRIGEYIAIRYLERKGQKPQKVESKSQKGFDLVGRIQVKVITPENKKGRNVRLKEGWAQFILILLDANYKPHKIGFLTKKQYNRARKEHPGWSKEPIVKRTMLSENGLIGTYGTVEKGFNL
jgi:hypothetical protein